MPRRKTDGDAQKEPVRKLPPSDPEARDEGPRLIPFIERRQREMPVENSRRYMDLAEQAIRRKRPTSERPRANAAHRKSGLR
jgi:hypothetical protein